MIIVGVDEVGRGALFGPVVACAYVCRQNKLENIYFDFSTTGKEYKK